MPLTPQSILARMPRTFAWLLSHRGVRNLDKEVLLRVLQRGMCVHDIGAHGGYYTRLFSDVVGPGGRVDAFEPIPATRRVLSEATADCSNVIVHELAVGDRCEPVTLTVPNDDRQQASLAAHAIGSWATGESRERITASMATVDDLIARGTIAVPDMMKVDVEGAELLVQRGAARTLAEHHPLLFVEAFADWTQSFGYQPLDLLRALADLGYADFIAVTQVRVSRLPPLSAETAWTFTDPVNVLCLPATPRGRAAAARIAALLDDDRPSSVAEPER